MVDDDGQGVRRDVETVVARREEQRLQAQCEDVPAGLAGQRNLREDAGGIEADRQVVGVAQLKLEAETRHVGGFHLDTQVERRARLVGIGWHALGIEKVGRNDRRMMTTSPVPIGLALAERGGVAGDGGVDRPVEQQLPSLQHDAALGERRHGRKIVADEQHGAALVRDRRHAVEAALLELRIADRKHLVDEQDLGLEMRGHREGQPRVHAHGVALHRRVDELLHAREVDDLVEARLHFPARHAEDRAVQEDVLAPGQLLVEAGADLEQASDAAVQLDPAKGRLEDARQDLEQRRLAGAVVADDADDLAALDLEIDVAQRPEFLDLVALDDRAPAQHVGAPPHQAAGTAHQCLAEDSPILDLVADDEFLAELVGADDCVGHGQIRSAKPRSVRRKVRMPSQSMKAVTSRLTANPGR